MFTFIRKGSRLPAPGTASLDLGAAPDEVPLQRLTGPQQARIVEIMRRTGGPWTLAQLAIEAGSTRKAIDELVFRLIQHRYVERVGRGRVKLTEQAHQP